MVELRNINEDNYIDCLNLKASVKNESFVDSVEDGYAFMRLYLE